MPLEQIRKISFGDLPTLSRYCFFPILALSRTTSLAHASTPLRWFFLSIYPVVQCPVLCSGSQHR